MIRCLLLIWMLVLGASAFGQTIPAARLTEFSNRFLSAVKANDLKALEAMCGPMVRKLSGTNDSGRRMLLELPEGAKKGRLTYWGEMTKANYEKQMVRLAQASGGKSVGRVRVEKEKVNEEDLAHYWPNFKTILAEGAILVFRFENASGENFQAFIGVRSFNNGLKIVLVDD